MSVPILTPPQRRWECPNCDFTDVTRQAGPHTRMHHCPKYGITAPMVEAGTRCKVQALQREDYIGGEDVQLTDDGRPITSFITVRDDGQDCAVFAPTAHLSLRS